LTRIFRNSRRFPHGFNRAVEKEIFEGRYKVVGKYSKTAIVRDYYNMITVGKDGDLYCQHDKSHSCTHVGFVLADSEIFRLFGVRSRRKAGEEK
jgi:hypothetical protein